MHKSVTRYCTALFVLLLLGGSAVAALLVRGSGQTQVITAAVTTNTILNSNGTTVANGAYQFGQVFARGDVPTGTTIQVTDHFGNPLVSQLNELSLWDDGSYRHASIAIFPPSIGGGLTEQLHVNKVAGTYVPGTDPRSVADLTGSHAFKMVFTDVRDNTGAVIGSGSWTADANTCIGDGTFVTYATGPVQHGVQVNCAARDVAPTTATLPFAIGTGTGSVQVNSTAGFPASGTFFVRLEHETALATVVDGTHLNLTYRGAVNSAVSGHAGGVTAELGGHLWVQFYFDIYTDPTNSANVLAIGSMPKIMLPWMNITGVPAQYSYHVQHVDGGTTLQDWSAMSFNVAQNATNIDVTNNTIDLGVGGTGVGALQRSECVEVASNGTLPAPFTANTTYWVRNSTGTKYVFYPSPLLTVSGGGNPSVNITDTGSVGGTMTITRRVCQAYRESWYSAADDRGNETIIPAASTTLMTALYPALTQTEQAYWIKSGMVPPYDLSIEPITALTAFNNTGTATSDSSQYRPGIALWQWNAIGAAGGPPGATPMPTWDVQCFMLQSKTAWDFCRAAGLAHTHMPWVGMLNEKTGHIAPNNNGAGRFDLACTDHGTGTPYSVLGPADPALELSSASANTVQGVIKPPNFGGSGSTGSFAQGNFATGGGDGSGPSQGHWPMSPYLEYLMMGREWNLVAQYEDASQALMVRSTPTALASIRNKQVQFSGAGTIYYGILVFGIDRTYKTMGNIAAGATLGASTLHQEKVYFDDLVKENLCYLAHHFSIQPADQLALGFWDVNTSGSDGLTTKWSSWGAIWGKVLTRYAGWDDLIGHFSRRMTTSWGERAGGWGAFFGAPEYNNAVQFNATNIGCASGASTWNGCSRVTQFAPTAASAGNSYNSGSGSNFLSITGGSPATFTLISAPTDVHYQNGDQLKIWTDGFQNSYKGPPEMNNRTVQEWFYVCNLVGTTTLTFNVSTDAGCASLLTVSGDYASQFWAWHPTATPATDQCVMNTNACISWSSAAQYSYDVSVVNWLTSIGSGFGSSIPDVLTTSSPAYVNLTARIHVPASVYRGDPRFALTFQPIQ